MNAAAFFGVFVVELGCRGNPDLGQDPRRSLPGVPGWARARCWSLAEASAVCREWIARYELGGGNWRGGRVYEGGKLHAYVSYNGVVWPPEAEAGWHDGLEPIWSPGDPVPAGPATVAGATAKRKGGGS